MIPQGAFIMVMTVFMPVWYLLTFLMMVLLKTFVMPLIPLPLWLKAMMLVVIAFWLGFFAFFEVLSFVQRVRGYITHEEHLGILKFFSWALIYVLLACAWETGFYLLLKPVSANDDVLKTYLFLLLFVFVIPTAWWAVARAIRHQNLESNSATSF